MTTTAVTAPGAQGSPSAGSANEGNLSSWVGPYVTGMLGQGQALANMPYQTYQGPLTAGPSSLQQNLFQGLGSINMPSNYGQSFSSMGAPAAPNTATPNETSLVSQYANPTGSQAGSSIPNPPTMYDFTGGQSAPPSQAGSSVDYGPPIMDFPGGQSAPPSQAGSSILNPPSIMDFTGGQSAPPSQAGQPQNQSIASQYMNPYLQASLQPQLDALTYQSQQDQQKLLGNLTSQGAFGGSRQAVAQGVGEGNLLAQQAGLIGSGYNTAYNNAQNQFNTEQGQNQNLANTLASIGGQQQALNQAGVTADYNEFLNQRNYPEQQVQFLQSLLSGLPISTVSNIPVELTPAQQLIGSATATQQLLQNLNLTSSPTSTSSGVTK